MGNEGSRMNRGSSFRRRNSKSGQHYIAEDEMDRNNNQELTTPKPARRMDKIRRSLSFRLKKKDKHGSKSSQQPSQLMLDAQIPSSASFSSGTTNNNSSAISSNFYTGSTQLHSASAGPAPISIPLQIPPSNSTSTVSTLNNKNSSQNTVTDGGAPIRPPLWIEDERKVRAGSCSFQVKYLGFQEVTDSRGMQICEQAIERLIAEKDKKKATKAILYVSGDSLRVVDESNKALIVDQTIEKVSFCAPDRHHENGFAYICRDGTARRWLCHGFMAIKDTLKNAGSAGPGSSGGERLSHAVGCAFSVCLEKKQKRERENVSMEVGPNHSFTRLGSFRHASITERFEDPQIVMPKAEPVPIKQVENPHAIERPKANPDAFNRQNPLRGSGVLQMPFKRNTAGYTSLRPGELPSFQQQKAASGFSNTNGTLTPTQSITKTSLLMQNHQQQNNTNISTNNGIMNPNCNINKSDTSNTINTISESPEENTNDDSSSTLNYTSYNSNNINNSTNQTLANQFNAKLTIAPTSISNTSSKSVFETSHIASNANGQSNFYQSVFATPQSMPPTPQIPSNNQIHQTPPPLPPMPSKYAPTTPMLYQQTPVATTNPYQAAPQLIANGSLMLSTPHTNNLLASPSSTNSTSNTNETFEQKWARIQAAKKTNPFAEDIAKKFEIKL